MASAPKVELPHEGAEASVLQLQKASPTPRPAVSPSGRVCPAGRQPVIGDETPPKALRLNTGVSSVRLQASPAVLQSSCPAAMGLQRRHPQAPELVILSDDESSVEANAEATTTTQEVNSPGKASPTVSKRAHQPSHAPPITNETAPSTASPRRSSFVKPEPMDCSIDDDANPASRPTTKRQQHGSGVAPASVKPEPESTAGTVKPEPFADTRPVPPAPAKPEPCTDSRTPPSAPMKPGPQQGSAESPMPQEQKPCSSHPEQADSGDSGWSSCEFRHHRVMHLFRMQERLVPMGAQALAEEAACRERAAADEAAEAEATAAETVGGDEDDTEEVSGDTFAEYWPAKVRLGGPHPDPVVETASLAGVQPPHPTFRLKTAAERDPAVPAGREELQGTPAANLSCLQLEAVTYACQRHEQFLQGGLRAGFLLGDGAGMGKGRTVAAIITENWLRGRKRHVWVSIGPDLKLDAERDLRDMGDNGIEVHALNKKAYGPLASKGVEEGVLFCSYSTLIASQGGRSTRLDQVVQWCGGDAFDGCIVFDECHKAKNLVPEAKFDKGTKTGKAVLEIQEKLPNARVVYCSATGASEARHLGYMTRMGLWGPGTAFPNVMALLAAIAKRGLAVLELIAMDMKSRGMYVCRTLSFQGALFAVTHVNIDGDMERMYNAAARFWADLKADFQQALEHGGLLEKVEGKRRPPCWGIFWAVHQRFFSIMCMAAKVPATARLAQAALEAGKCVVVGLQSTGEARTEGVVERCGTELDDWVSGPREMLLKLVEDFYPMPEGSETSLNSDDEAELRAGAGADNGEMHPGPPPWAQSAAASAAAAAPVSAFLGERYRFAQLMNADSSALGGSQGSPGRQGSQGSQGRQGSHGSPGLCIQASGKYSGSKPCSVCNGRTHYGRQRILQHCASCDTVAHKKCFLELEKKAHLLQCTGPVEFRCQPCIASLGIEGCEYKGTKPCSGCGGPDTTGIRGKLYLCAKCNSVTHASCVPKPKAAAAACAAQGGTAPATSLWECSCCTGVPTGQVETSYWGPKTCGECSDRGRFSGTKGSLLQCATCKQVAHKKCFESQHKENIARGPSWSCQGCLPPPPASRDCPPSSNIFEPVHNHGAWGHRVSIALMRKAKILEAIHALELPNNPLDELVDRLGGPDAVAEMTGRKGMIVRKAEGPEGYEETGDESGQRGATRGQRGDKRFLYQQRTARGGASLDQINILEKEAFMAGEKLVAIISDAASVGISLQADRRAANQRRRVHITLELPWSADKAIQQFGRTHRSNQVSAPEYHVLFTELGGEKRFASTVAARLESLGALTQGDRRASGLSLHEFNYGSVYGSRALECMYKYIMGGNGVSPVTPPGCQPFVPNNMCYGDVPDDWERFFESARAALLITDVIKEEDEDCDDHPFWGAATGLGEEEAICTTNGKIKKGTDVKTFLNRLLGLMPGVQRTLFHYFSSLYAHKLKEAKESGEYDRGLMVAQNARLSDRPLELFVDPTSGAKAYLHSFKRNRGLSWEAANKMLQESLAKIAEEQVAKERERERAHAYVASRAGMAPPSTSPEGMTAATSAPTAKVEAGAGEGRKVAAGQSMPSGVIYVDEAGECHILHAGGVKPDPGLPMGAPGAREAAPAPSVKPEPGLASAAASSPFAGPQGTGVKAEPGLGGSHAAPAWAASGAGRGVKPEPFVSSAQFPDRWWASPARAPAARAKPEPGFGGSPSGAVPGRPRGAGAKPNPLDGFYLSKNDVQYRKLPSLVLTRGAREGFVRTLRPYDKEPKSMHVTELKDKYSRDRSKDCRKTAVEWAFQYRQRADECQHGKKCQNGDWCSQGRRIIPLQILSGAIFPIWNATDICYDNESQRRRKFSVIQVAIEEGSNSTQDPTGAPSGSQSAAGSSRAGSPSAAAPGASAGAGQAAGPRSVVGIKLMPEPAFLLKGVLEAQRAKKEGRPVSVDGARQDVLRSLSALEHHLEMHHAMEAHRTNNKKRRGHGDDEEGVDGEERIARRKRGRKRTAAS